MKIMIYGLVILITVLGTLWAEKHLNAYSLLFRDTGYQNHVEINAFIITRDQLTQYFCCHERPQQIPSAELAFKEDCFLLIEAKNRGSRGCWGDLKCRLLGKESITIDVFHPNREDIKNEYSLYIVDLGRISYNPDENAVPVSYKWVDLYTK